MDTDFESDWEEQPAPPVPYQPMNSPPQNIHMPAFIQEAITQFDYRQDKICPICLEPLGNDECCMVFRCSHVFHCPCIQGSMETGNGSCPVCRKRIKYIANIRLSSFGSSSFGSSSRKTKESITEIDNLIFYLKKLK